MSAWNNFVTEAFNLASLPKTEQRKRKNALELALFVLLGGTGFNLVYAVLLNSMNYVSLASLAVIVALIFYYYFSKNYTVYRTALLLSVVVFGVLAQISLGGYVDASGVVLCGILPALGALIIADFKTARWFFVLFIIACIFAGVWEYFNYQEDYHIPRSISLTFFVINFIAIGGISFSLIQSFYQKMNAFQGELEVEQEQSEQLLNNILPLSISKELKETGEAQARGYASASVIFADIVGFSDISRALTPGELVSQLNVYIKAFDDIVEKYGIEKIKTIGDAYLAVSGIPEESFTHAQDAVKAALEMQEAVNKLNAENITNRPFQLRVGIHSGPLIAGVVGKKKFTYDIWGDTVNTAARLEANSVAGKVNISQTTYNMVFQNFECTSRGKIQAKNMGEIEMYFVEEKV